MTNADKVRKMSDEELAGIMMCPHDGKPVCNFDDCRDKSCIECSLQWLQRESEQE